MCPILFYYAQIWWNNEKIIFQLCPILFNKRRWKFPPTQWRLKMMKFESREFQARSGNHFWIFQQLSALSSKDIKIWRSHLPWNSLDSKFIIFGEYWLISSTVLASIKVAATTFWTLRLLQKNTHKKCLLARKHANKGRAVIVATSWNFQSKRHFLCDNVEARIILFCFDSSCDL